MKNSLIAVLGVCAALALCAGCSATPDTDKAKAEQPETKQEPEKKGPTLTEEEISQIMTKFAGVSRDDAADVLRAKRKAQQAEVEYRAYLLLLYRESENNQELLRAALRTNKEAKELLDPLCGKYPHNNALNSTANVVIQAIRYLEAQKE